MKFGTITWRRFCPASTAFALSMVLLTSCDLTDQEVAVHVSSYKNLCGEIAEVMCSNMFQCCTEYEIQQSMGVETDVNERECRRDKMLICEERLAGVLWALENRPEDH